MSGLLAAYEYTRPFVQPLPIAGYWWVLVVPLLAGVCVVYKSVKCRLMSEVPRAAVVMLLWTLLGFMAAAVGVWGLVEWQRA